MALTNTMKSRLENLGHESSELGLQQAVSNLLKIADIKNPDGSDITEYDAAKHGDLLKTQLNSPMKKTVLDSYIKSVESGTPNKTIGDQIEAQLGSQYMELKSLKEISKTMGDPNIVVDDLNASTGGKLDLTAAPATVNPTQAAATLVGMLEVLKSSELVQNYPFLNNIISIIKPLLATLDNWIPSLGQTLSAKFMGAANAPNAPSTPANNANTPAANNQAATTPNTTPATAPQTIIINNNGGVVNTGSGLPPTNPTLTSGGGLTSAFGTAAAMASVAKDMALDATKSGVQSIQDMAADNAASMTTYIGNALGLNSTVDKTFSLASPNP